MAACSLAYIELNPPPRIALFVRWFKSTLKKSIHRIALFVVLFQQLTEQIDLGEINDYLVALARDPRSPSRISFKHMVYGLRYYYRLLGMNKNAFALPSL